MRFPRPVPKFRHPFLQAWWSYSMLGMVVIAIVLINPQTFEQAKGILWLWMLPAWVGIPAIEVLLLIRERRFLRTLRQFWYMWLVSSLLPCCMHVLALQHRWVLHVSIVWLICASLVFPFFALWFMRMWRREMELTRAAKTN